MDCLAAERGVTLVADEGFVSDVGQHTVRAIAGQFGKIILDRDPSLLSLGASREDDQWACAQGAERPRLRHGNRSFFPFVALAARRARGGPESKLHPPLLKRQIIERGSVRESSDA